MSRVCRNRARVRYQLAALGCLIRAGVKYECNACERGNQNSCLLFDCTVLSRARVRDNVMQNMSRTCGVIKKHCLKMIVNNVTVAPV